MRTFLGFSPPVLSYLSGFASKSFEFSQPSDLTLLRAFCIIRNFQRACTHVQHIRKALVWCERFDQVSSRKKDDNSNPRQGAYDANVI